MKNPFSIFCEFIKKFMNKFVKEEVKTQDTQKEMLHDIHKDEVRRDQKKDYKPYILNQKPEHTINGTITFKGD